VAWKIVDLNTKQVVTDSRFTALSWSWKTKTTIDKERAFQEANKINIDFSKFLDDVLDSEKELFKACLTKLNERTSGKTIEFDLEGCSYESIDKFIGFMNKEQAKVECKRSLSPSTQATVCFETKNPSAV
jgi:hypothetical protein